MCIHESQQGDTTKQVIKNFYDDNYLNLWKSSEEQVGPPKFLLLQLFVYIYGKLLLIPMLLKIEEGDGGIISAISSGMTP